MSNDNTFRISRIYDAPLGLVWKAWTDKSMAGKWFGPKGCTVTYSRFDIEAGGEARYGIEWEGASMHGKWSYLEVVPKQKLVSVVAFTDTTGDVIIEHPGHIGWPKEIHSTITFTEKGKKTEVLVEWKPHNASEAEKTVFRDGMESMKQGWGGSLDQLEEFLEKFSGGASIMPYLFLRGNCEEAINYYKAVLGAKLENMIRYSESPAPPPPGMVPENFGNKVMHSSIMIRGTRIMLSDGCETTTAISGVALSLSLTMSEIDGIFAKLAEGGSVTMPLGQTFFSPRFGMLTDKFGVPWMLIVPEELG